jgi:hypothetical protein
MKQNVGGVDKFARIITGLTLIGFGVTEVIPFWVGLTGFIPLATGQAGWCPVYQLVGMRTCSTQNGRE